MTYKQEWMIEKEQIVYIIQSGTIKESKGKLRGILDSANNEKLKQKITSGAHGQKGDNHRNLEYIV